MSIKQVSLSDCRVVQYEEGKKVADSWKAPFLEASAKDNEVITNIYFVS